MKRDNTPDWYAVQRCNCSECGWVHDGYQVFREDGCNGDGVLIDGDETSGCPEHGIYFLVGRQENGWIRSEAEGALFVWEERKTLL